LSIRASPTGNWRLFHFPLLALFLTEHPVVFGVMPHPEPDDISAVFDGKRPVVQPDAH